MRSKRRGSITIVVLLVITGLLAHAVMSKMTRTAVSAHESVPQPAIAAAGSKSANNDGAQAVFIGDFTQGSNEGGVGGANWTSVLAAEVRKVSPFRMAVNNDGEGSGYAIRGATPTFEEEVRRLVTPDARMVVISGSRADVVAEPKQVTAAAREAYQSVSELAPRAQLIVVGPSWGNNKPIDQILQTRDAVRAAADAAHAHFVDPIQDDWFTNSEPGLIGSDGVHPTDLGNQRIAQYLYPVFMRVISEHA